ncbi:MAG: DUF1552 domain-containing protein [Bdellovibrionales bacterium]|nr:DUF1552 domain-containing protein [Oligoflexia bacterium]
MPRRTFIRGAGLSLALPFLEAMLPVKAMAQTAAKPKIRYLTIYKPDGIVGGTLNEVNGQLPNILNPLQNFRSEMSLMLRLENPSFVDINTNYFGDGHAQAICRYLTCEDLDYRIANTNKRSLDHVIGDLIGKAPLFVAPDDQSRKGPTFDLRYFKNISWIGPGAADKLHTPQMLFDRLFMAGGTPTVDNTATIARARAYKKSLLDYALGEITRMTASVGASDKSKLDEYFTGLRTIESQATAMPLPTQPVACVRDPIVIPQRPADYYKALFPPNSGSHTYEEWLPLMYNLIYRAFQCDEQQLVTLQLGDEVSNYCIDSISPYSEHELSHYQGNLGGETSAQHNATNKYHIQQLANLVGKLKANIEPDGKSILDKSMILYGIGMSDSSAHEQIPNNLLIGRASGRLNPQGKYLPTGGQRHANLLLKILQTMGSTRTSFGNSTGVFPGL